METLMTVKEVAVKVQLSVQTIYRYVMNREIPFLKFGRAVRFQQGEIQKWTETKNAGLPVICNENHEGSLFDETQKGQAGETKTIAGTTEGTEGEAKV